MPVDPQPVVIETMLTDIGFSSNHCIKICSFNLLPIPTLMLPKVHVNQNETAKLQFKIFGVSTCNQTGYVHKMNESGISRREIQSPTQLQRYAHTKVRLNIVRLQGLKSNI